MPQSLETYCEKVFSEVQNEMGQRGGHMNFPYDNGHRSELGERLPELTPVQQKAEDFILRTGVEIRNGIWPQPRYWSEDKDWVQFPYHRCFFDLDDYYHMIFHEMGHWTGYKTRLNRPALLDHKNHFTPMRMIEETRAQMHSACLSRWFDLKPSNRDSDIVTISLRMAGGGRLMDHLDIVTEMVRYTMDQGGITPSALGETT